MDNPTSQSNPTAKIVIFVVILIGILVIVYFIFVYYSCDEDEGFFGGGKSDISVNWNIEDMVNKIHSRQATNLSRLSRESQHNF